QPVADAAYGLEPDRVGRVALDLAAQPVDLDVDGALADVGFPGDEFVARNGFAGAAGEDRQYLLLAVGQLERLAAALQFAARDLERIRSEDELLDLRRGHRTAASQYVVDAQDELARIEGFGQVVVGACLEPGNAA